MSVANATTPHDARPNPAKNSLYRQAVVTLPGLGTPGSNAAVDVQASRVAWGLTIMK